MADWVTPPTFVDGQILGASQLNALSTDLDYLRSIAQAPNIPWEKKTDPFQGIVRHLLPSLWVQYNGDNLDFFRILYQHPTEGDTEVYLDDPVSAGVITQEIDLTGAGLTLGELYVVTVSWEYQEGHSSGGIVYYLHEGPAG